MSDNIRERSSLAKRVKPIFATARSAICARLAMSATLALFGPANLAFALPPPPPASDGTSGSFNAQLGTYYNSFNTDTGVGVGCDSTNCPYRVTVPFEVVTYDGRQVHAFNFTDINLPQGNPAITIYGSAPALFLANQGISIGSPLYFLNGGLAGGAAAPNTATAPGGNGAYKFGGRGGVGRGGETQACGCCPVGFTASGGGGGGNVSQGQPGLEGVWPPSGQGTDPMYPGGQGGVPIGRSVHGGGGGGAGGGGNYEGNYFTTTGAAGGGGIVFGSTSTIAIMTNGSISTNGVAGQTQSYTDGSSGGGAGGGAYFFATTSFANAGLVTAQGGAGGANTAYPDCNSTPFPGPNGGNGSGGFVEVNAPTIANTGTINVSDGGGTTAYGGAVSFVGKITSRGTILGRKPRS